MDYAEIASIYIDWCVQRLFELDAWVTRVVVTDDPEMTPEEWTRAWLIWALRNHFLFVLAQHESDESEVIVPCAFVLIRPIESDLLDRIQKDYFGTLFEFQPEGDTAFVDAAYGPGHYPALMKIIAGMGKPNVAWEHFVTEKVHCVPIEKMPQVLALYG